MIDPNKKSFVVAGVNLVLPTYDLDGAKVCTTRRATPRARIAPGAKGAEALRQHQGATAIGDLIHAVVVILGQVR